MLRPAAIALLVVDESPGWSSKCAITRPTSFYTTLGLAYLPGDMSNKHQGDIHAVPNQIVIIKVLYADALDADINILNLSPALSFQTPTSITFICSLDKKPDFSPKFYFSNPGRGRIESTRIYRGPSGNIYQFRAHLFFHHNTGDQLAAAQILAPGEVKKILYGHSAIACKARILTYLGFPYYSETLYQRSKLPRLKRTTKSPD